MAEQQVMTKDPKKVEVGKRLAECNHRKREELKAQKSKQVEPMLTSSHVTSYYIYQAKVNNIVPHQQPSPQRPPKANKFEME